MVPQIVFLTNVTFVKRVHCRSKSCVEKTTNSKMIVASLFVSTPLLSILDAGSGSGEKGK